MNNIPIRDPNELVDEFTKKMEMLRSGIKSEAVVPSGFKELDKKIGGFQPGRLYVVGARPAMGKTALMVNWIRNIIDNTNNPKNVLVITLECSAQSIMQRLVSCMASVPLEKINRGGLTNEEWKSIQETTLPRLRTAPLLIEENTVCTLAQLREKCLQMKEEDKLGIVFIDYLQLITPVKGRYRDEEIAEVMRGLKDLSKEAAVPFVVLSQLSRAVEYRNGNKLPRLTDLRDSGTIEQIADVVMFIYRPEYYDILLNELDESTNGEMHLRIAKNRMGELDIIELVADLPLQHIYEKEDVANPDYDNSEWKAYFERQKQKFKPDNETPF
jgi:replicative DNA helicase